MSRPTAELQPAEFEALAHSASMRAIHATVGRVAMTDVTVLISGETGVGKELVARALHRQSRRRERPFVRVNCAALPLGLLESELFGHERGAFTGADHPVRGKFEQAHTGTIFLDEIGEIPPTVQAKLLHVLQDRSFARLGSERDLRVDVRIVAATNRDLETCVREGSFRADLFYRLNVVHLRVPPLRERREEIPVLVQHFLSMYARQHGRAPLPLSAAALERFRAYSWPGNVRELENVVQRIVVCGNEFAVAELAEPDARPPSSGPEAATHGPRPDDAVTLKALVRRAAEAVEREALKRMLERVRWRRVEAAQRLGINDKTLREKIRHYGLDRADP